VASLSTFFFLNFYYVTVFPDFIYEFALGSKLPTFAILNTVLEEAIEVTSIGISYLSFAVPFVVDPSARKDVTVFLL
jgi:hypothetical protein